MGLLDSIKNVFGGDDEEKKAAEALYHAAVLLRFSLFSYVILQSLYQSDGNKENCKI